MSDNFYNSSSGTDLGSFQTLSTSFTGVFSGAVDIKYYKLGSLVVVVWPIVNLVPSGPGQLVLADPLPVGFGPTASLVMPVHVSNNGVLQNGLVDINAGTRIIKWVADAAYSNFTGPGNCGPDSGSICFFTS